MAGHIDAQLQLLNSREGIDSLTVGDLRELVEAIREDTSGDMRLAFNIERRADMLELNMALPSIEVEIIEWAALPAEERGSAYPKGERIGEVQGLLNLEVDGVLGADTLNAMFAQAQSELKEWHDNPENFLATPVNLNSAVGIMARLAENIPASELAAYQNDYNHFLLGEVNNAAQVALVEAHSQALGLCSELEVLSLQNIFTDPENFTEMMALVDSEETSAMGVLNEKIKGIVSENCAHIIEKLPEDRQEGVVSGVVLQAQLALMDAMNKADRVDAPEIPERPEPDLPNDVGPNGEKDISFKPDVPLGAKL